MTDLDQRLHASREMLPAGRDPLGPEEIRRRAQRRVVRKRAVLASAMVAIIGMATFGVVRLNNTPTPLNVAAGRGKGSGSSGASMPATESPSQTSVAPSPSSVPGSVPTTTVSPAMTDTTDPSADQLMRDHSQFMTPSGNIRCALYNWDPENPEYSQGECAIESYDFPDPPRPPSCEDWMDWAGGNFIFSSTEDPGPFCGTDTLFRESPMPTLGYGESVSVGDLRCDVATDGVTCRSTRTGKGFKLSRSSVEYY